MESKIKSALERALERAESLPKASPDEIARIDSVPQGKSIGASFMDNNNFNLNKALDELNQETKRFVLEGLQEVLLIRISLPADEHAEESNRRAMEGILIMKEDQENATAMLDELENMLQYYRHVFDQTAERFNQEIEMRSRGANAQGIRGTNQDRMDFRQEWATVIKQLDQKFEAGLIELKERIKQLR